MNKIYHILSISLVILLLASGFDSHSGFASDTRDQNRSESVTLIKALRQNGIGVPENSDYDSVVKTLQTIKSKVPEPYRENVLNYLDSKKGTSLILIPTSKEGLLSWYFENVIFLRKDLVFASYNDGEMYGGDILLKVIYLNDQIMSMKTLWNYHQ